MKWNPKVVIALSTAVVLLGGSSEVAAQTEERPDMCYGEINANGCLPDIGDQAAYCVLKCGGNWQINYFNCVDGVLKCYGTFTPP